MIRCSFMYHSLRGVRTRIKNLFDGPLVHVENLQRRNVHLLAMLSKLSF